MKTTQTETAPESHPLEPFLPVNARILILGSFPPKRERWSMDFFYPNFTNDFWRIIGMVFFDDRSHFITCDGKHFDKEAIMSFCRSEGIAMYDTAASVRRLKDNASDKFLEIISPADIPALLERLPECRDIAVTGQKAAETAAGILGCSIPSPGSFTDIRPGLRFWRMPSTSRAYPLPIEKKAEAYRRLFGK